MAETKDSAFSEFFRNATEEEKRKVYQEVMEKATQSQIDTLKEIEENTRENDGLNERQ